jgi:integrase/recombinase XerD
MEPSIHEHLDWCRAAGFSDGTIRVRRDVLARALSDLGPSGFVDPNQLVRWFAHDGWCAQTRATYFGHINGYHRWAVRTGRSTTNPMALLNRPRVPRRTPRPVPVSVFERIVATVPDPWRLAALLARYAGLRCAEIARARRQDFHQDRLIVLGKGGHLDTLPTHPELWSAIVDRPRGHLIVARTGQPYRPTRLSNLFSAAMRENGYTGVTLHPLRHLYATSLLLDRDRGGAGANVRVVQQLCRHASLATTEGYLKITDRECEEAIWALPAVA